jgi:hypothetical protein
MLELCSQQQEIKNSVSGDGVKPKGIGVSTGQTEKHHEQFLKTCNRCINIIRHADDYEGLFPKTNSIFIITTMSASHEETLPVANATVGFESYNPLQKNCLLFVRQGCLTKGDGS